MMRACASMVQVLFCLKKNSLNEKRDVSYTSLIKYFNANLELTD